MTDYSIGIAYGTGYIAKENGKEFLFVRNLDPYYPKTIEAEVPYKAYESKHNIVETGKYSGALRQGILVSYMNFQKFLIRKISLEPIWNFIQLLIL